MAAPVKSSSLDPISTFLLRECIEVILPYMIDSNGKQVIKKVWAFIIAPLK